MIGNEIVDRVRVAVASVRIEFVALRIGLEQTSPLDLAAAAERGQFDMLGVGRNRPPDTVDQLAFELLG